MKTNKPYIAIVAAAAAIFLVGSAVPGEAKGKKKEAAPAPTPVFCFGIQKPVCAVKGGMSFTYANACYAAKDGAKVSKEGPCKEAKAKPAKKMKAASKKK